MGQRVGDGMDTHCRDGARDGVEDRIAREIERARERKTRDYRINIQIEVAWAVVKVDWLIKILEPRGEESILDSERTERSEKSGLGLGYLIERGGDIAKSRG